MKSTTPRVVAVGLDGATWDLIKPWAENGELPTFRQLMAKGFWGNLKSTTPPLSPSAWVSIYTGCKPSKHGIFGFVKRKQNSYFYRPITSKDIKVETLWEILSDYGLSSIIINALFMYPPRKTNGVIITGLGTPSTEANFVYPPEYKETILKKFPKYDVDFNEDLLLVSTEIKDVIKRIGEVTKEQIKLTKYLFKNEEWDFLFSIFRALDVIQHYFWEDKKTILKFYKIFDEFLSELLSEFKNDPHHEYVLFLVSDHGFGPVEKYFCVNNWLEQNGFLKTIKASRKLPITAESVKRAMLKLGMRRLVWKFKRSSLTEKLLRVIPSERFGYLNTINWNQTLAYYYEGSDGIININLMGREPSGIVSPENYKEIVEELISKITQVTDPETGEPIVERAYTKEELFNTNDPSLPDVYLQLRKGYRAVGYNKLDNSIFAPPIHGKMSRPGDHYPGGIFLAYGKDIPNKASENEVHVWDVTPTILGLFGIPPSSHMDGTPLFKSEQNMAINKETLKLKKAIKNIKMKGYLGK